jgi:hypothetical protein
MIPLSGQSNLAVSPFKREREEEGQRGRGDNGALRQKRERLEERNVRDPRKE